MPLRAMILLVFMYHSIGPGWPSRSELGNQEGARGLDCFLLRGLEKVDGERTLMAITHNIGKLHRAALAAS
jgi:hypothetical protein